MIKRILFSFLILSVSVNIFSQIVLPEGSFDYRYFESSNNGINFNFTTSQISNSINFLYLWDKKSLIGLGIKLVNYGKVDYTTLQDTNQAISPVNYPYVYETKNLNKIGFDFYYGGKLHLSNYIFNLNFYYLNFLQNPIILNNSFIFKKSYKDYSFSLTFYDLLPIQNFGSDYLSIFEPKWNLSFSKIIKKENPTFKLSLILNFLSYRNEHFMFIYKDVSVSPSLAIDYIYKNIEINVNTFSEKFTVSFLYSISDEFKIFSSYGKVYSTFQYFSIGLNFNGVNQ
ncbi:MAG: hypothetical protein QME48_05885 [bacterium]|uniref:Uncharacterized protein n=2 Tax=Bacteria candidate phyla TaxID=1783234 RepID=A0A101I1V8_UNCT6|nr:MAG: hypothetical protein XD76_0241 [candidate division TA06 bacterium 32_111]KUK86864.1 MAG: hypothetical protein XE03_1227 [candidate division TA06 bacterium 34_109]MDI6700747.1 hypothetical protein [bacterium]HAF07297.1 hypothetical protein [candidate division WOR-3 bacterium]HCP16469.1 hypothetical protein [candidate division WOR-3 bacterium]